MFRADGCLYDMFYIKKDGKGQVNCNETIYTYIITKSGLKIVFEVFIILWFN